MATADYIGKITQGDAIETMRMLDDDSVNLIVIDPPYNIGKDARWDKWRTVDEYIAFMGTVFTECERVLAPNGSFYWFHNDMVQIRKLMDVVDSETSFVFKQLITWNKRFDGARNKGFLDGFIEVEHLRNYQKMAEYCLFYTFQDDTGSNAAAQAVVREYLRSELAKFGKPADINRLFWLNGWAKEGSNVASHFFGNNEQNCLPTEENYKRLQSTGYFQRPYESLRLEYESLRLEYESLRYTYNNQKTDHSVWNYEIAPKLGHITPKPVPLIENIIAHSSNPGDIVLDCFGGSGTTAVACANLDRRFILIEREPEYVEIANKRI